MAPPPSTQTSNLNLNSSSHCCTLFLFKLTILSAVLLLLALPSRSPEPSTLLAHFWELLHLLLVGIAVSYGLFSRKTPHFPISDETQNSLSDLSTMFHVPSSSSFISPDGSDPKASSFQAWNSQYNQTQSVIVVANGYKSLGLPVRSLKSTVSDLHGNGLSSDSFNGNLGNTRLACDSDRALPAPISWRSRSGRMEVTEKVSNNGGRIRPLSVDETQFESLRPRPIPSSGASKPPLPSFSNSELPSSKMEDLRYKNMEMGNSHSSSLSFEFTNSKMDDLRYKKMEIREEMDSAHFRPPSIDETECESPKSESCRSDASFSSNASSLYSSSNNHSPLQSVSSELPDSNIQELEIYGRLGMRKESTDFVHEAQFEPLKSRPLRSKPSYLSRTRLKASSPDNQSPPHSFSSESSGSRIGVLEKEKSFRRSSPPTMPMGGEARLNKPSNRKCSNGSLLNVGRHVEGTNDRREFPIPGKASWTGKSVRTIRHSSRTGEARYSRDGKSGNMLNGDEAVERGEARTRARGYDNPPRSTRKQDHGSLYPVPDQALSMNRNSEKDNVGWKFDVESEEDVDGNVPDCSEEEEVEEELVARAKSGVRADPGEVDKKADEFIAKFREQIRLQKTASIDLSGELNINDNYFR